MLAKELAAYRFNNWLQKNKMVRKDQALAYLTVIYAQIYGGPSTNVRLIQYAPSAAERHLSMLRQEGLMADEEGFLHAPRLFGETENDHCSEEEQLAIWFQIFIESMQENVIIVPSFKQSPYEQFAYLTPNGEVFSVCVVPHSEECSLEERKKQLCPEDRLKKCQIPDMKKGIRECVDDMTEILVAGDEFTAEQLKYLDSRCGDLLRGRPVFVLDEHSVKSGSKIPKFTCFQMVA